MTNSVANKVDTKTSKYSHGVKTTLIWSTLLSFATVLIYTLKGSITVNIAAQNLIAGILARPLIVIFIAFIISQFFKSQEKQIKKFNSILNFIMLLTSTGEFLRWIVILGLY